MTKEQKNAIRNGVIDAIYKNTDDYDKAYFDGLIYALRVITDELSYFGEEEKEEE